MKLLLLVKSKINPRIVNIIKQHHTINNEIYFLFTFSINVIQTCKYIFFIYKKKKIILIIYIKVNSKLTLIFIVYHFPYKYFFIDFLDKLKTVIVIIKCHWLVKIHKKQPFNLFVYCRVQTILIYILIAQGVLIILLD